MADTVGLLAYAQTSYINGHLPQLLSTLTLGSTATSITYNVQTPYPRILFTWAAAGSGAAGAITLNMQFNGDSSTSHYAQTMNENNVATVTGATSNPTSSGAIKLGVVPCAGTADYWASGLALIADANQAGHYPTLSSFGTAWQSGTTAWVGVYGGMYLQAVQISSITILPANNSLAAGSTFSFYGLS